MSTAQPSPSYRETKEQNVEQKRYWTLWLSNISVKDPLPIHCLFCGFTVFAANALPVAVMDGMLHVDDAKRSLDVRCKKCKATCRVK
jgi:hypothetical protein